ncbi:MAG: peptidoglycan -binding protein [Rhodobacteraceae bacterium]|nr:peptidoglycan -binding protein [Paracoccaceae bacterium]
MALSRRTGQRFQASIWPGFVDAMTGLLLVLMFVLTIFMIVQFVLRETISGQENELNSLQDEITLIAEALGLEKKQTEKLGLELNSLAGSLANTESELRRQAALISTLTLERETQAQLIGEANSKITLFEAQVAGLISQRDNLNAQVGSLQDDQQIANTKIFELQNESNNLKSDRDQLELALASARNEISAAAQAARMAAAQREVFESMIVALEQDLSNAEQRVDEKIDEVGILQERLSEEEEARIVSLAVAKELRERLKNADAELTAMTLMLESQRQKAEDTLTLLAAADNARNEVDNKLKETLFSLEVANSEIIQKKQSIAKLEAGEKQILTKLNQSNLALAAALSQGESLKQELSDTKQSSDSKLMIALGEKSETEKNNIELRKNLENALVARLAADALAKSNLEEAKRKQLLLNQAEREIENQASKNKKSKEELIKAERQTALLNQQLSEVRKQLGELDTLLSISEERDQEQKAQLKNVGSRLNQALASLASEERKRRKLEEKERQRLEEENNKLANQAEELANYKSEFFGRLRTVLMGQERVRIVGDRFVFSSEVLFSAGRSDLSKEGKTEISNVTEILSSIMKDIPENIDWVIRVDGHTDSTPLSGAGEFKDNWELSQARALSVVKYMINELNFSGSRLAANGFGEYQPISFEDTPEARALNRRIEIKLTER